MGSAAGGGQWEGGPQAGPLRRTLVFEPPVRAGRPVFPERGSALSCRPRRASHPRWDYRLESGKVADGWTVETESFSGLQLETASHFQAIKRRFYFEHEAGPAVFDLDGTPGEALLKALRGTREPDDKFRQFLIESINKAYCPELFPQMARGLYLWIGHRFQEQPSHGYVANQSVSDGNLGLFRPRLPARLAGAFDHQADHLLLEYGPRDGSPVRLRVDHPLFVALECLRQGLPRQLLPDRELNRLDAFLEQLRRADVPKSREFFIHNHDERTTARILTSWDGKTYEECEVMPAGAPWGWT